MHDSYFNRPSSSVDFSFNFSVRHLRKNFSDSLDGLSYWHVISPIDPSLDLLDQIAVLLVSSPVVVHVVEGKLDSREPVADV